MANTQFVVQAFHYAQFMVEEIDDDHVNVEILDEDDCDLALVAVRDDLEAAVRAAEEWREVNDPDDEDTRGARNMPLASINIYEVTTGGAVCEGRFVQSVEI